MTGELVITNPIEERENGEKKEKMKKKKKKEEKDEDKKKKEGKMVSLAFPPTAPHRPPPIHLYPSHPD